MIRSASLYIGKVLKAAVVSMAAAAFLISAFLCCCLTKSAHAQTPVPKASSHCQAHKADQAKKQESKTCDCCKIVKNDPGQAGKVFELVQSLGKSFKIAFVADYWAGNLTCVVSTHLAYQGPPRANESLPIYLQVSSLRL